MDNSFDNFSENVIRNVSDQLTARAESVAYDSYQIFESDVSTETKQATIESIIKEELWKAVNLGISATEKCLKNKLAGLQEGESLEESPE